MQQHFKHAFAALALATLVAVPLAGGCARHAHTRGHFGVQNRTFFDRQAAAAGRGSAQGLDSEEAAAIHSKYRDTVGKPGAQSRNDPGSSVLILQPENHRDAAKR